MAPIVLRNCKILLGGYDFSGESNQLSLDYRAELLEDTVFNSGVTRSNVPGLKTTAFSATILHNPEEPEDGGVLVKSYNEFLFERIGATREILTVCPVGEAIGDIAYSTRQINGSYTPLTGGVGELMAGELTGSTFQNSLLTRGILLDLGTKIATGTSTPNNFGAVAEGKTLYSSVHVVGVHGTIGETIDIVIESDDAVGFATPTTRLTHTQFTTARGASWQESYQAVGGGGITDAWWRAKCTIAGAAAEYRIYVTLAIQ